MINIYLVLFYSFSPFIDYLSRPSNVIIVFTNARLLMPLFFYGIIEIHAISIARKRNLNNYFPHLLPPAKLWTTIGEKKQFKMTFTLGKLSLWKLIGDASDCSEGKTFVGHCLGSSVQKDNISFFPELKKNIFFSLYVYLKK